MTMSALETCMARVRSAWGPLSTALAAECRAHLAELLTATPSEPWLAGLHLRKPANEELYRDPVHGFVLLAHTETEGLYRPPHDHGAGWVIYAIQRGEIEMGGYAWIEDGQDEGRLVRRDTTRLRAGDVAVYLPGDIHDTRCLSAEALLFRFTDRDLRLEDKVGRLTRYAERNGAWAPVRP